MSETAHLLGDVGHRRPPRYYISNDGRLIDRSAPRGPSQLIAEGAGAFLGVAQRDDGDDD